MTTRTLRSAVTGLFIFLSAGIANAAVWTAVPHVGGTFTIDYKDQLRTLDAEPSANLVSPIYFFNGNLGAQSPAAVQQELVNVFPELTSASQLTLVGACDANASCAGPASSFSDAAGFHVNSTAGFDYLALHIGGGELFLHWSQPVTSFVLSGLDTGNFSNFRAYSVIPVPGALALFLSGLGVLVLGRRRKLQTAADGENVTRSAIA
jgi:hypothetical protein